MCVLNICAIRLILYVFNIRCIHTGILTAVNCLSVRWAMKIQNIFTTAKLLALVAIVVAGMFHIAAGNSTLIVLFIFLNLYFSASLESVLQNVGFHLC